MSMLLRGQDSIDEVLRLSKDHDSIEKLNETQESEDSIEYTKEIISTINAFCCTRFNNLSFSVPICISSFLYYICILLWEKHIY